jgi:hypothetical protein
MLEIEKNVPAPSQNGAGRPAKYPFAQMQPGDSIFVPGLKTAPGGTMTKHIMLHPGQKFATRKEEGGMRIWRIA